MKLFNATISIVFHATSTLFHATISAFTALLGWRRLGLCWFYNDTEKCGQSSEELFLNPNSNKSQKLFVLLMKVFKSNSL